MLVSAMMRITSVESEKDSAMMAQIVSHVLSAWNVQGWRVFLVAQVKVAVGMYLKKKCIKSTVNVIDRVGDLCTSFYDNGKCDSCTGDCNIDTDCNCSLHCAQKNGSDPLSNVDGVPGCEYLAGQEDLSSSDDDYYD